MEGRYPPLPSSHPLAFFFPSSTLLFFSLFLSFLLSFFSSFLQFVTKRGHAHADHVGCSQVIAYLWAARACGPSMSPLTPILTFVSSTMLEVERFGPPVSLSLSLSLFLSVSLSPFPPLFPLFILYLDPLSWILPTGLYLSSLLNEEMTELICDFNTCLPDDTLSAPCRGPKRSFSSHPPPPPSSFRSLQLASFSTFLSPFGWTLVLFITYFVTKFDAAWNPPVREFLVIKIFHFCLFHFQDSVIQN